MGHPFMKKTLLLLGCIALTGCAGNTVVQLDDDEYQINDQKTWTYSGGTVLNYIVQQGRKICADKGKKFKMIDNNTNNAYQGSMYAGATVHFKCIDAEEK